MASLRFFASTSIAAMMVATPAFAQDVPIVLPGAPGEESRTVDASEAARIADNSYSEDDVGFLQMMIPHHYQAVRMARLVNDRTNNETVNEVASRILTSQDDEIAFMQAWLSERGEMAPDPASGAHMDHAQMDAEAMDNMGMASAAEITRLASLNGTDFDALFLELMIAHHEGAIRMVRDLLQQPGAAYDPVLYDFISDVRSDQEAEIKKMNLALANLSPDPRVGLAGGFLDAGEAISNLRHVAFLQKPAGFYDPANPSGQPMPIADEVSDAEAEEDGDSERRDGDDPEDDIRYNERAPLLSFAQTDMAFYDDKMVVGNYHGFNIYRLTDAGQPQLISSVVCPGGQGDVSVVGDILIMSVEQTRGRVDCGLQGVQGQVSKDRFRGIRIFDIGDVTRPKQVGLVQTCRGSHTHSVVDNNDERIVVYVSGTSFVRDEEELAGCVGDVPGDARTSLFSIDVVEIPLANPAASRITSSPRVFESDGQIAGLWRGGDHGEGTQSTYRTDMCHDITIFPDADLAAGACSGNGIILDISDVYNPKRIAAVTDQGFAYWHSATFNNDGTKVVFTDEWGGGGMPRCRASDPKTWGANAIYSIENGELVFQSYYKLPAAQSDNENCVAHNGSVVPVPGRDIFAQAWYQGGLSISDWTDAANPEEIAFFDRGPVSKTDRFSFGGYWSTYYYDGYIYGTEITRGLDVFELTPSEHLSANEIAAAKLADMGDAFNPQQQYQVSWPAVPVVAKAYLDQLERDGGLDASIIAEARAALEAGDMAALETLAERLDADGDDIAAKRRAALKQTLMGIIG
ncbi:MAG: DUF305 domain-containing protein [Sphingomonas sp.]|nr:DUF305 domain-containing protein [Sphingomonas sp.]